jgi:hypothetical protein
MKTNSFDFFAVFYWTSLNKGTQFKSFIFFKQFK